MTTGVRLTAKLLASSDVLVAGATTDLVVGWQDADVAALAMVEMLVLGLSLFRHLVKLLLRFDMSPTDKLVPGNLREKFSFYRIQIVN